MGVDKTREGRDDFELNLAQYKEDSHLKGSDVSRHLVACCSKKLQSVLSRVSSGAQCGGPQGGDQGLLQL